MTRSLNVLSKILGLTASSNPHEAKAAEAKLEQQLLARGITKEQLEKQLDMQTVEEDLEATVIAVSMGAKVIERHITLSHDMWGTDQKSSLEVMGMDMLRKRCMQVNEILGSAEKVVTKSEIEIRKKLRR